MNTYNYNVYVWNKTTEPFFDFSTPVLVLERCELNFTLSLTLPPVGTLYTYHIVVRAERNGIEELNVSYVQIQIDSDGVPHVLRPARPTLSALRVKAGSTITGVVSVDNSQPNEYGVPVTAEIYEEGSATLLGSATLTGTSVKHRVVTFTAPREGLISYVAKVKTSEGEYSLQPSPSVSLFSSDALLPATNGEFYL